MMIFGQTVTVFLEERNDFGDVEVTDERQVTGCAWYPRRSVEDGGGGSNLGAGQRTGASSGAAQVSTGLSMICPPGSGITALHRVRLPDGSIWQVVGEPGAWASPFSGWKPGDQLELDRTAG